MPDIVIFRQDRGIERLWVAEADVDYWLRFWNRGGCPAARWRDYRAWGGFFPPVTDSYRRLMWDSPPENRR